MYTKTTMARTTVTLCRRSRITETPKAAGNKRAAMGEKGNTVDSLFSEIQGTKEKQNLVSLHSNIFVLLIHNSVCKV